MTTPLVSRAGRVRSWLIGALVLAALALLFAAAFHARREPFRRYVSPPLVDGTRYTFLYPATFTVFRPASSISRMSLRSAPRRPTRWDDLRMRLLLPTPRRRFGFVSINVMALSPHATSVGPNVRQTSPLLYGSYNSAAVSLLDTRNRRLFLLRYTEKVNADIFRRNASVVTNSFQILPPGAPVPK